MTHYSSLAKWQETILKIAILWSEAWFGASDPQEFNNKHEQMLQIGKGIQA